MPSREFTSGFDITQHVRLVCADMIARLPELGHIDLAQVAISYSQTRQRGPYGIQATLTPMRFAAGALTTAHAGRRYTVQRLYDRHSGRELLYILTLYLPRFLDHPLEEKLATILHELWHIGPAFDGDLRRFPGRNYAHGDDQKQYDAHITRLTKAWLAHNPPETLLTPLRPRFAQLQAHHGQILGLKIRKPKLLPLRGERIGE